MCSEKPWRQLYRGTGSVSAICGFMCNTNYLQTDLGRNAKRAAILVEFTDYILGRNAQQWDNEQPFITTDEMAHVWTNWKGKRLSLFTATQSNKTDKKPKKEPQVPKYICKRFNVKVCPKQDDKDCVGFLGSKLRHICNKFMGNSYCGKDHPRLEHK